MPPASPHLQQQPGMRAGTASRAPVRALAPSLPSSPASGAQLGWAPAGSMVLEPAGLPGRQGTGAEQSQPPPYCPLPAPLPAPCYCAWPCPVGLSLSSFSSPAAALLQRGAIVLLSLSSGCWGSVSSPHPFLASPAPWCCHVEVWHGGTCFGFVFFFTRFYFF